MTTAPELDTYGDRCKVCRITDDLHDFPVPGCCADCFGKLTVNEVVSAKATAWALERILNEEAVRK